MAYKHGVGLASLLSIVAVAACTSILGDDFEIGAEGGSGGVAGGTTSSGQGGQIQGGSGQGGGGQGGAPNDCGNGEPDPGETCDGDCPTECIDPDLCTTDILEGDPADCNVTCTFEPTVVCQSNDGCCPSGCHPGNDNDCSMSVAVVHTDPNGVPQVVARLDETGRFGSVVEIYAWPDPPDITQLASYDALLVYFNAGLQDSAPVDFGNTLAEFHDTGGRVVTMPAANCEQFKIEGRFLDDGYLLQEPGAVYPNDEPVELLEPNSPLLAGVAALPPLSNHCVGAPLPGTTTVAGFTGTGDPVVLRGQVAGRKRVDLNFYPVPIIGNDDAVRDLIANALAYQ